MSRSRRPAPSLSKARAYWQARRFSEALREYAGVLREGAADPAVTLEAARAFAGRRQATRALAMLDKATRQSAQHGEALLIAGRTYQSLCRWQQAENCYRRACQLSPAAPPRFALARLCERRHQLDEANSLVAQILHTDRANPDARLLQARILQRTGRGNLARDALIRLSEQPGHPPETLAAIWAALADVHDRNDDCAAAWDALEQSKSHSRSIEAEAWNVGQAVVRRFAAYAKRLDADFVKRLPTYAAGEKTRQMALLAGFPRSGTTLLEQALDAHPQLVATEEDEYFAAEIVPMLGGDESGRVSLESICSQLTERQIADARTAAWDAWQALHADPVGERLHLDKNPASMLLLPIIRQIFPETKLIIALRDPRDVVLSCYFRSLPVNPVSAWFHTLQRVAERYAIDMRAWLRFREIYSDWVEIRYEATVADFSGEMRRLVAALGLAWDERVAEYRAHQRGKVIASPTYADVAKPVYSSSVGRWRRYERQLEPVRHVLDPIAAALGYE